MAFWTGWLGGGMKEAGEGVKTALDGAGGFLKDARIAITGKDPELDGKILAALSEIDKAQSAINLAEAGSSSLFIAGWRPAIGWVCVCAVGWHYFIGPTLIFMLQAVNITMTLPVINISELNALLLAMLGMSGLRSIEKVKEVAR